MTSLRERLTLRYPRTPRWSVRARYTVALTLVALLSGSAFFLLRNVISAQESSGAVINVSGRQRMLSQRTTLFAQRLVNSVDEREAVRETLARDTDLMERSHLGLTQGDAGLGLPGRLSKEAAALYFDAPVNLDAQVKNHITRVRALLSAPDAELTPDNPNFVEILEAAPGELLASLNAAVSLFEAEAGARITRLQRLEKLVFAATLLALLLEGLLIFRPMEREIKRRSELLLHTALHDALTGLPNRALYMDRLGHAVERANRHAEQAFAVLFLDFDRFKVINDSLGHNVGDALLRAFGERLAACVRASDTVARLGGDEFTILLEAASSAEAERVATRVNEALLRPFEIGGHTLHLAVSIGIVVYEGKGVYARPEEVLRDADIAMYRAKAAGKAGFQIFNSEMRERALSLMSLETDLRGAVARGELEVHYQPIVSVSTGEPTGLEALVRWQHPEHGRVSPAEFIPLAEETGLIIDIDRWVLREACGRLAAWERGGLPALHLSVNLSSRQFSQEDLPAVVGDILRETGFPAQRLKLEMTESLLASSSDQVTTTTEGLKALGVGLHIDDFGTGYSSLSYLQRFSATALKIDRSFIDKMTGSQEGGKLVATIVAMAHTFGMAVVAEGVETPEQLDLLRALRCEYSQGYLHSKPLDAAGVAAYLQGYSKQEPTLAPSLPYRASTPSA